MEFTLQDRFAVENKVFDDVREGTINPSEGFMMLFITRQCCLKKTNSVELSCGFLAKQLNLTKRYMTKIEKSLEEKGYITVTHNSKNKLNLPNTITIAKSSVQNDPTVQKDTTVLNEGTEQNNPTVQNEGRGTEQNDGSSSELNDPHNKTIEDNTEDNNKANSVGSNTVNDSVVKNETTVTPTTDESKKIYEWVKKTLDNGKRLLSNYRDAHTREEADELWNEISKTTSLMDKAIAKNKLTEKQCEMLYEYKATASMANDSKEKYLSKVSGGNNVTSVTTTESTVTSSESSSYHPDGNGYCNGKFIECKYEQLESGELRPRSVGQMLYKLHKLSGEERDKFSQFIDEQMTAYARKGSTADNTREHLTRILAEDGEEAFLSMLKSIGVEIEEDVEAPEIETPNEDNVTSETLTEPSQTEERAYGEDDFDHFTYTEEKTSLRDNSRRLDFGNPPF